MSPPIDSPPIDPDRLSKAELKRLVVTLLAEVADLRRTVAAQRDEIARLKGAPPRPNIKPSGMEKTTDPKPPPGSERRTRGDTRSKLSIDEERIVKLASPPKPGEALQSDARGTRCRRRAAPLDAPCRCAGTDAGGPAGREARDAGMVASGAASSPASPARRSTASHSMPPTCRAAAPGPMPVARSAASPLIPARGERRRDQGRQSVARLSTCPAAAPGPMPATCRSPRGTAPRPVLAGADR
jgi:hypothetical protein